MRLPFFPSTLVAIALLALSCTSRSIPSGQCEFDRDCSNGEVCVDNYCRPRCLTVRDCPANFGCVTSGRAGISVCVAPTTVGPACTRDGECAPGQACLDGRCRAQCERTYDCQVTNPAATCMAGRCVVVCAAGRADCDRVAANGCEADLRVSPTHCGACGAACTAGANQDARCTASRCERSCRAGFADCDGNPATGCETNLRDAASCAACGVRCPVDRPLCAGDPPACASACTRPGETACGGACVDLRADLNHCGACGRVCPTGPAATPTCTAGTCAITCDVAARRADCDGAPANGCEVTLTSDVANCGACRTACPTGANASPACMEAVCRLVCNAGFANCDLSTTNGCEVNTNADVTACGACGRACPTVPFGRPVCTAGACDVACNAGYSRSGGACVPLTAPRLIGPLSGSIGTTRRPVFRWAFATGDGLDGARVELCRDRSCRMVLATFDATGTSGQPTAALPAGVYFWRAYGRSGTSVSASPSAAVWQVVIPARDAPVNAAIGTYQDVNGDGFTDALIGEPFNDAVYVHHGGVAGIQSAPTATLSGTGGSEFGASLAMAGDVNGDGYTDALIGAPGAQTVVVYHGSPTGLQPATYTLTSTLSDFGRNVARAGDLNGDGYGDVLVNAGSTAEVYAFYGSATGLRPMATATRLPAPAEGLTLAVQPFAAGAPLDGDGFDDIAVAYNSATGGGVVHWFRGGATGLGTASQGSFMLPSVDALASAGDVDGDGFADLVVGSPGGDAAPGAAIYRGSATGLVTSTAFRFTDPTLSSFGTTVMGAGDVNGDGFGDFAVGDDASSARVYYGRATLTALESVLLSARTGVFGHAFAALGDVNRDGIADLLVGAPDAPKVFCYGAAYFYAGSAAGLSSERVVQISPRGKSCSAGYGATVAQRGSAPRRHRQTT
jgi:hypothetical protein